MGEHLTGIVLGDDLGRTRVVDLACVAALVAEALDG